MIAFDIRLFGAIEIRRNGELLTGFRSQKALVLLAYLLCEQRPVAREYLAGLGWPESDQSQALGLLRRSLHDLQQQLPGCLAVDNRTVRFSPTAPVTTDLQRFVALATQDEPDAWSQAVALYRAPFLQGIYLDDAPELENWLVREQERWQGEVVRLLNRLSVYHRFCNRIVGLPVAALLLADASCMEQAAQFYRWSICQSLIAKSSWFCDMITERIAMLLNPLLPFVADNSEPTVEHDGWKVLIAQLRTDLCNLD